MDPFSNGVSPGLLTPKAHLIQRRRDLTIMSLVFWMTGTRVVVFEMYDHTAETGAEREVSLYQSRQARGRDVWTLCEENSNLVK